MPGAPVMLLPLPLANRTICPAVQDAVAGTSVPDVEETMQAWAYAAGLLLRKNTPMMLARGCLLKAKFGFPLRDSMAEALSVKLEGGVHATCGCAGACVAERTPAGGCRCRATRIRLPNKKAAPVTRSGFSVLTGFLLRYAKKSDAVGSTQRAACYPREGVLPRTTA